jgi:hypothetical protein
METLRDGEGFESTIKNQQSTIFPCKREKGDLRLEIAFLQ